MKNKGYMVLGAIVVVYLVSAFAYPRNIVSSDAPPWLPDQADVLCGNASEADDYGFNYNLQQYHWTVDGERYLESETIDEIDKLFDQLVDDQVAETMILFKPADEVGNRVNCAVHFLRYMGLGNPTGERKDNGFVFLVVVEEDAIDVHYGVGLGLPALTAHNLTDLNRMAEEIYADTGSMDDAILTMAYSYANYAREQYPALTSGAAAANTTNTYKSNDSHNLESNTFTSSVPVIGGISTGFITCLCCISLIILVMFVMIVSGLRRPRRRYMRPVIRPMPPVWRPPTRGFGGGFGSRGGRSGGFSPPRMRGGSGSGRSGRGN